MPTIRGPVAVRIERTADACAVTVSIPANMRARVVLPPRAVRTLRVDDREVPVVADADGPAVELGSGTWRVAWP